MAEGEVIRIARILDPWGEPRYGMVQGGVIYALRGDPFADFARGAPLGPVEDFTLLAPISPSKILAVGRNYAAHAAEHGAEVPREPLFFLKPPSSVIGPGQAIVHPRLSRRVEHEAELALVIGRRVRKASLREAGEAILGYTCGNDVTARDIQRQDAQWTRGKGFDTFCPLGPWIAVGLDASDLEVTCRVNGELRQRGRTSQMIFPPAYLVSYISQVMTLEPGDVILTGTPAGVGILHPGDVVEVEIEGIGVLRNPVVSE